MSPRDRALALKLEDFQSRRELLGQAGRACQAARRQQDLLRLGQATLSLFDEPQDEAPVAGPELRTPSEWSPQDREDFLAGLAMEEEVLGMSLDFTPLDVFLLFLDRVPADPILWLSDPDPFARPQDGDAFCPAGLVSCVRYFDCKGRDGTRQGARFTLADEDGSVKCLVWPDAMAACSPLLAHKGPVKVVGYLDPKPRTPEPTVIVTELLEIEVPS